MDLGAYKDPNGLLCTAKDPKAEWARISAPSCPLGAEDAPKEEKPSESAPEAEASAPPDPDGFSFAFDDRRYTVKGLSAYGLERLKVTVKLERNGGLHLDTLLNSLIPGTQY